MIKGRIGALILCVVVLQGCLTTNITPDHNDLIDMVIEGNIQGVSQLLEDGGDPNWISDTGRNALHAAIINSDQKMIKLLLDNGGDLSIRGPEESSCIALAVLSQNWDNAHYIIEMGADNSPEELIDVLSLTIRFKFPIASEFVINELGLEIDPTSPLHNMMLIFATVQKQWNVAYLLVEKGADINFTEGKGRSVLRYSLDNIDMIRYFIDKGVNINHIPNDGLPVITYAAKEQNIELVNLLLANGAEVNPAYNKEMENGKTPLPPIMIFGFTNVDENIELAKLLFENGADLDYVAVDDEGSSVTALTLALKHKREAFASFLIENGADVTLSSGIGSPLDLAKESELTELVKIIEEKL